MGVMSLLDLTQSTNQVNRQCHLWKLQDMYFLMQAFQVKRAHRRGMNDQNEISVCVNPITAITCFPTPSSSKPDFFLSFLSNYPKSNRLPS